MADMRHKVKSICKGPYLLAVADEAEANAWPALPPLNLPVVMKEKASSIACRSTQIHKFLPVLK